ncbi:MAG: putative Ig domain-containing protein [Gammaproteobacteria bacterium]|nr:putative Ig domain-containing protein [Gammaproteobacteria bacterium]
MNRKQYTKLLNGRRLVLFLAIFVLFSFKVSASEDTVCAVVKIEIEQTLTLERQAFDARMKITNGLDTIPLENVNISVNFEDADGNTVLASSDPNDTNALFCIRIASKNGVDDISCTGTIEPQAEAEINWLIIPAPGSGGNISTGKQYLVGATLTYDKGGVEEVIQVAPDDITVKPMPLLTLDYFLPNDVTADDAFTTAVEPPVPFTLGVRVRNNGSGPARNLKIESAQPKIVENEQGVLIGFKLIGSTVGDQPVTPSLLADFGDIPGNSSGIARWLMTVSLSGRFTEFTAEFSHSDELGGELTSLIDDIQTHFLIHDVLVDVPGRDNVRDFLARDGDIIRVYESDTVDTIVSDVSTGTSFVSIGANGSESVYRLTVPVTAGFMVAKVTNLFNGRKVITEVIRSDGKRLSEHNAWFSQSRPAETTAWEYFFNLFDANTTGSYTVVMRDVADVPQAPVLQFVPNRVTYEGNPIGFIIEASDPNGSTPVLTAAPLPAGANFVDQGAGQAQFNWIPATGQAGLYTITYKASDGTLNSIRVATIRVNPAWDTDGDGMDDDWERQHFGNLDRDGMGDFDGDGISDLQEFLDGTDPQVGSGLTAPTVDSPLPGTEVTSLTPDLTLTNSVHAPTSVVQYDFEIYADAAFTDQVTSISNVAETPITTTGTVATALSDNTGYYWRARAFDGLVYSQWVNGRFFVNTANNAPEPFDINFPADTSQVDNLLPLLSIINSSDIDGDTLTYHFDVYDDSTLTGRVAFVTGRDQGATGATEWTVTPALTDGITYYWQATAVDEHGAERQSTVVSFTVNTGIDAPGLPSIVEPALGSEVNSTEINLVVNNATDPAGTGLLYYFEIDTVNRFNSASKIESGSLSEGIDTTTWTVNGLTEDTLYYWRAKASTGTVDSGWVQSNFVYNAVNSAPDIPTVSNPDNLAWVETVRPMLAVHPSMDQDDDTITYRFELYSDAQLTDLVRDFVSDNGEWSILFAIPDNSWSYWRVRAEDEHGAVSDWTTISRFFVNNNGIDDAPTITMIEPSVDVTDVATVMISWDDNDPDSNASVTLFHDNDNSGADGVLLAGGIAEDSEGAADTYQWDTSALPSGTYYVYAEISDALSSRIAYAPGSITVTSANTAPELVNPIADQSFDVATGTYDFTLLSNTFNDSNGDTLTYSVTLTGGAPLPSWLMATPVSDTVNISGTPSVVDVGDYTIRITTTDPSGNSVFDEFVLTITDTTVDLSPSLVFIAPAADVVVDNSVAVSWTDDDPDSSATIALYHDNDGSGADGTLIVNGIPEDDDGIADRYDWNTTEMANGVYHIYAIISDANSSVVAYLPYTITVDRAVAPEWQDVTGQLTLTISNPIRNRRLPDAKVPVEISNPEGAAMTGPLRLVIRGLIPDTLAIGNANGVTDSGEPYIDLTPYVGSELISGGTTGRFNVIVQGGGRVIFTFTPIIEQFR